MVPILQWLQGSEDHVPFIFRIVRTADSADHSTFYLLADLRGRQFSSRNASRSSNLGTVGHKALLEKKPISKSHASSRG